MSWNTAQISDIKYWNSRMFWLRICYQWNIWEKLLSTRAASVTNGVYSHRSRGGTAGGSARHLDSTPPSPWQPALLRSKTWFSINDALQMCLGLNWKQAMRQRGILPVFDQVRRNKNNQRLSGVTVSFATFYYIDSPPRIFSSVSLASTLSEVHMESICFGCFWQQGGKLSERSWT